MIQEIIVAVLFILAISYTARLIWKQFATNETAGCAKGCNGCNTIDVNKIEAELKSAHKGASR